ncbi:hypothetical protein CK203_095943 [Vitis vinifera]|uniref:Uncharacterized protein n=1 Tax=Vitis vinifera TaxID=29760 RepID=A0A438CS13_VITVI|nr:hypothetical protein CK203_095943 [Vitis vinifera]
MGCPTWVLYILDYQEVSIAHIGSGLFLFCVPSCIAALLGAQVFLTDLPDRLRLLKKNVETNLKQGDLRGSATVHELTWGDDPEPELIEPLPDYDDDRVISATFTFNARNRIFIRSCLLSLRIEQRNMKSSKVDSMDWACSIGGSYPTSALQLFS